MPSASFQRVLDATAAVYRGSTRLGSAVLVDRISVLTAHHVVGNTTEDVEVYFPSTGGRLVGRLAELPSDSIDLCRIYLQPPDGANVPDPAPLWPTARLPDLVLEGGFPLAEETLNGVWFECELAGPTASGLVQARWRGNTGSMEGQSGGPVVDRSSGILVGVLVEGSREGEFDRIASVDRICALWPDIPRPWLFSGVEARTHLLRRSTGQRSVLRNVDVFSGRDAALAAIQQWRVTTHKSTCLVITGQPGAGKSAVLGRAALLAESAGGRGVIFHARDASFHNLSSAVMRAAGLSGVGAMEDPLDALADATRREPLSVFVDALDEAASMADRLDMAKFLTGLASLPNTHVVVATRPMAMREDRGDSPILRALSIESPQAPNLVDLDSEEYGDPAALKRYVAALLSQQHSGYPTEEGGAWFAYRREPALRDRLAEAVAERAAGNFLVAGLTADRLASSSAVVDPRSPGFMASALPQGVGEALDKYISGLPEGSRMLTVGLLVSLAFARGLGIDDSLWVSFANSLDYQVTRADLDRLRASAAADFLLETRLEPSGRITRLFHQALVDQLLAGRDRATDDLRIFEAVLTHASTSGGWDKPEARYALAYGALHARDAGQLERLLADLGYLASVELHGLAGALGSIPALARTHQANTVLRCVQTAQQVPRREQVYLLAVTAFQYGLNQWASDLCGTQPHGWRIRWAHPSGGLHRQIPNSMNGVRSVAVSQVPGRAWLALGGDRLEVWDSVDRKPVMRLADRGAGIRCVKIGDLDGPTLISGGSKGIVAWDLQGVKLWENADLGIGGLTVARLDGQPVVAAIGGYDNRWTLYLLDSTGTVISTFTSPDRLRAVESGDLDGQCLVVSTEREILIQRSLEGHPETFTERTGSHLAIGMIKGLALLAATDGPRLRAWGPTGQRRFRTISLPRQANAVAIGSLASLETIAVASGPEIRCYDERGAQVCPPLRAHVDSIGDVGLGYVGHSSFLVSTSSGESAKAWELLPSERQAQWGHLKPIKSIAASDELIFSGGGDGLRSWTLGGEPVSASSHTDGCVGLSQGDGLVLALQPKGSVTLWDARDLRQPIRRSSVRYKAAVIGQSGEGHSIFASSGRTLYVLDDSLKEVGSLSTRGGPIQQLAVSLFDGQLVAIITSERGDVCCWNPRSNKSWLLNAGEPILRPGNLNVDWISALCPGVIMGIPTVIASTMHRYLHVLPLSGERGRSFPVGQRAGSTVVFERASGPCIAAIHYDRRVRLWSPTGKPATSLAMPLLQTGHQMAPGKHGVYVATGTGIVALDLPRD